MKYRIEVKVEGWVTIEQEAETLEAAEDLAKEAALKLQICDLSDKVTYCQFHGGSPLDDLPYIEATGPLVYEPKTRLPEVKWSDSPYTPQAGDKFQYTTPGITPKRWHNADCVLSNPIYIGFYTVSGRAHIHHLRKDLFIYRRIES